MAVTVMTKNKGSPLVTGEVGVSIINCRKKQCHKSDIHCCWITTSIKKFKNQITKCNKNNFQL